MIWLSQSESELVAKDDNLDAADPNKDKKAEDKDEPMDEEQKEKINEQGDQVKIRFPPCERFFSFFIRDQCRIFSTSASFHRFSALCDLYSCSSPEGV